MAQRVDSATTKIKFEEGLGKPISTCLMASGQSPASLPLPSRFNALYYIYRPNEES